MKKALVCTFAILPCLSAYAIKPVEEAPAGKAGKVAMQRTPAISFVQKHSAGQNIFFEGFEERPEGITMSAREWLPDGWLDVSKCEHTPTSNPHNLTWQVLDEDSKTTIGPVVQNGAHEGYAFAYIMADVAYDGHTDLDTQDEWLITPVVTPGELDWFYFKLFFNPGWTVYNRAANDFTGQNNSLEVYVSEDDGQTWKKAWSLIDDYIKVKYTDSQLRESLIDINNKDYNSIYVNIHEYAGKSVKFAFRYFGSLGHPMAIDNVAVGVPEPDASYKTPYAALRQGISPNVTYPADPRLYIPFDYSLSWKNTSKEFLNNEWTYADVAGTSTTATTIDLETPGYSYKSAIMSPSLISYFENAATEPYQAGHKIMQAGGILSGKDSADESIGEVPYEGEFGVSFYDITEPDHKIVMSSDYVGFNPDIDLAWEMIQGVPDGDVDVDGICNMYPYGGVPYGFDYIDVVALVKETFDPNADMKVRVFSLTDDGAIAQEIGYTSLKGSELPEADPSSYVNIRFKFPVPVYVSTDFLVMITNPCRDAEGEVAYEGNIVFPYVKSKVNMGNTLIYQWRYTDGAGWYDGFFNMNYFPLNNGIFGGILMNLGASYSAMERLDEKTFAVPAEGGSETFKVKAHHNPDRWALTLDGVTVPEWLKHTAVYDEATDSYDVTLTATAHPADENLEGYIYLVSPGSLVAIPYSQPTGVDDIEAEPMVKVYVEGQTLRVEGATGPVEVFNAAGAKVASAISGGSLSLPMSDWAKGVYMVRTAANRTYKVVK